MSEGKHYVIGDIHKRYDILLKLMEKAEINPKVDYIYCLGDLRVGRTGGDLKLLANFIDSHYHKNFGEPGFYVIRGNHDVPKGNDWGNFFNRIALLPELMRVKVSDNTFVLVHGGLPVRNEKYMIRDLVTTGELEMIKSCSDMEAYIVPRTKNYWQNELYLELVEPRERNGKMGFFSSKESPLNNEEYIIHGHIYTISDPFRNNQQGYMVYSKNQCENGCPNNIYYAEKKKVFDIDTGCGYTSKNGTTCLTCLRLEDLQGFSVNVETF